MVPESAQAQPQGGLSRQREPKRPVRQSWETFDPYLDNVGCLMVRRPRQRPFSTAKWMHGAGEAVQVEPQTLAGSVSTVVNVMTARQLHWASSTLRETTAFDTLRQAPSLEAVVQLPASSNTWKPEVQAGRDCENVIGGATPAILPSPPPPHAPDLQPMSSAPPSLSAHTPIDVSLGGEEKDGQEPLKRASLSRQSSLIFGGKKGRAPVEKLLVEVDESTGKAIWASRSHAMEKLAGSFGKGHMSLDEITTLSLSQLTLFAEEAVEAAKDAHQLATKGDKVGAANQLRKTAFELGNTLAATKLSLQALEERVPPTSRVGYLMSLEDLLPRVTRPWQEEWVDLLAEHFKASGRPERDRAWVEANADLEGVKARPVFQALLPKLAEAGWPTEAPTDGSPSSLEVILFTKYGSGIGRILREKELCLSATIYALVDALAAQVARQKTLALPIPPRLYWNLHGALGLVELDPAWEHLEVPDKRGFCGVCSMALVKAHSGGTNAEGNVTLQPEGFLAAGSFQAIQDSDIVCFETETAADPEKGDTSLHMPIILGDNEYCFPPNTLFRLVGEPQPSFVAPDGTHVQRRLLTVRATYMRPTRSGEGTSDAGKMLSNALSYGTRQAYVDGMDDIIARPPLTMEQEFHRQIMWVDWKGVEYTLSQEYQYVTEPAKRKEGCTPGVRDDLNDGKTPYEFLEETNAMIRERRAQGHGLSIDATAAELTLEEVLSVRLYTGPAYQPINEFLRQVSVLKGAYRLEISRSPQRTFAATIGALCRAIRKLAAIATPEEASMPLYRGVRGELPNKTWVPDKLGIVCVVDTAFMSTSTRRETPISYMGLGGENVLWELSPQLESDVAFHRGADVSRLSQFAAEKEILFPPCTMMMVHIRPKAGLRGWGRAKAWHITELIKHGLADADDGESSGRTKVERSGAARAASTLAYLKAPLDITTDEESNGKRFQSVRVTPHFV